MLLDSNLNIKQNNYCAFFSKKHDNYLTNIKISQLKTDTFTLSNNQISFKSKVPLWKTSPEKILNKLIKDYEVGNRNFSETISLMAKIKYRHTKENFVEITQKIKTVLPENLKNKVQFRLKSYLSIYEKLFKKLENERISNFSDAEKLKYIFYELDDILGARLSLTNASKNSITQTIQALKNSTTLKIQSIDNFHAINRNPYIPHDELEKLLPGKGNNISTRPKESGYKGLHTHLRTNDGIDIELQIKSQRMTDFGNGEHSVTYKAEGPLGKIYKNLTPEQKQEYKEYRTKVFNYIDDLESGIKGIKEPKLPDGIPKELNYKNLIAVGKEKSIKMDKKTNYFIRRWSAKN